MTYVSEGLRGALVPERAAHPALDLPLVLLVAVSVLLYVGVQGFYRRAID